MKSWKKPNYDCMLNVIYVSLVYTSLSEYNKNISNILLLFTNYNRVRCTTYTKSSCCLQNINMCLSCLSCNVTVSVGLWHEWTTVTIMFRVLKICSSRIWTKFHRTNSYQARKMQFGNDVNSSFRVTVIGSGGRGTSKSLLIIPEQPTPLYSM